MIPAGSTIAVIISGTEEQDLVEQALLSSFQKRGLEVFRDTASSARYQLSVSGAELVVSYEETFRISFLGESKTKRMFAITLPYLLSEASSGKVIGSEILHYALNDTISVDMIPSVEQRELPATIAPLPERSFFDKLVEPVVIIGATGVAVFLFFHVRS